MANLSDAEQRASTTSYPPLFVETTNTIMLTDSNKILIEDALTSIDNNWILIDHTITL